MQAFLELRQTSRAAALALLLVAAFVALTGSPENGALLALPAIGVLATVRHRRARTNRRLAGPAIA